MSRGGASRRHGHGATAAGSAGAPGSRILARPVVSVVVGGRRPGFDAVGRYHALFSASSLAADALASARLGSGVPLVPLRSVQAKACFGARPAFDVVGLLHGACARTEVHQVSLEIWTSNSHLSVSADCFSNFMIIFATALFFTKRSLFLKLFDHIRDCFFLH